MKSALAIVVLLLSSPWLAQAAGTAGQLPAKAPSKAQAAAVPAAKPIPQSMAEAFKKYEELGDDLALRILVKREAQHPLTYTDWLATRRLLHRRPGIGYSLLFKWDTVPFTGRANAANVRTENKLNAYMSAADELMTNGQFQQAFTYYQTIARYLKKETGARKFDNQILFLNVQHSMARALFGAGRLEDALKVYNGIGKNYPRYRQVLYEKMWTAFRGGHADIALGAIASQLSTYFSAFMEPEAYLVQIYIYKKLCRVEEQKAVRKKVVEFRDKLRSGEYGFGDWARSDLETYSLYRLTQQPLTTLPNGEVSAEEEKREQQRIEKLLTARFEQEKARFILELNRVLAYSYLSVGVGRSKLKDSELDDSLLRQNGLEFWPVDDAEDWLDELGDHLYIGKNQCAQQGK